MGLRSSCLQRKQFKCTEGSLQPCNIYYWQWIDSSMGLKCWPWNEAHILFSRFHFALAMPRGLDRCQYYSSGNESIHWQGLGNCGIRKSRVWPSAEVADEMWAGCLSPNVSRVTSCLERDGTFPSSPVADIQGKWGRGAWILAAISCTAWGKLLSLWDLNFS